MKRFLVLVVVMLVPAWVLADVESGPKAGEKVAELKALAVVGTGEGKEIDYTAERKDGPTVYYFVNAENFSRPMARFMKVFDGKIGEIDDKAAAVAIWVGGDKDANKDRLPRINMSLKFDKTSMGVFTGEASGPNGWALNTDAHLTVVVVNKGKVVKSFAYTTVNETDVEAVEKEFKKAVGK